MSTLLSVVSVLMSGIVDVAGLESLYYDHVFDDLHNIMFAFTLTTLII